MTDLYWEKLSRDRESVLFEDQWVPFDIYEEKILVRPDGGSLADAAEITQRVRWVSHHGPILTDLLSEDISAVFDLIRRGLSARWPGFSDQTTDVLALRGVVEAETLVEMKEGEWKTYNVLPGGQSGHAGDEHFADQLPLWLSNQNFQFWVLRGDVEMHAVSHRTYPEGFPTTVMQE